MGFFNPQNPGIGGLNELTAAEEAFLTSFAGLAFSDGDILYYDNGALQRLPVGADGTYLKLVSGLPAWSTVSGGGDVTKVGTPVNNQIAVWTGDGTLEGTSDITYDGTSFNIITGKNFQIAGVTILSDSTGTTTLQNIDSIDATTETTLEAALELASLQGDLGWSRITGTPTTLAGYGITDAIDGSGVAGRVAFFSDANTLTTESRLTYDSVNGILGVHKLAGDATDGLLIESNNGTDIGILGASNTANVTWYGSHNFNTVTASRVAQFGASKTLESSTVTTTELGYLSGVTSAIQTQINAKFTLPSLTSGSILFSDGSTIAQDNANFKWIDASDYLQLGSAVSGPTIVGSSTTFTNTKSANTFVTMDYQNRSNGTAASTDFIWYNDAGTDTTNYLDIGINSSTYTGSTILSGAGDAYIYNQSEDLVIGTATVGKNVIIFTGGTGGTAASKTRATFTDTGLQMMNGSASAPSISFTGSTTTGFYQAATSTIGFSIAGVSRGTWSASTLSINSSNGGTMDFGSASQILDFNGTVVPGSNTFQTIRTTTIWAPDGTARTNAFGINNSLALAPSSATTVTTLVGNRSAIVIGATATGNLTSTDAMSFEARQLVNNSATTPAVTNEIGFLANNMTNTISTNKRGFVSELTSGTNKHNLYISGTAQNWLEGSTGIGISVPTAKLHVVQTGTTTPVQQLSSTATNDDPTEITLQSRVATTNATVTTLATIATTTGYSYLIVSRIIGRRTGGAGGAAGDYATYEVRASANNEGGVLNIDAVTTTTIFEDQAGWDATIDASGTDIRVRVTGAASNNITWHATTMYYLMST